MTTPAAPPVRSAPVAATVALAVLGIALLVIGVVYFARTASALPSFLPGHQAGSAHHHVTHGAAAVILGAVSLAGAWFSTGSRPAPR
jgi:hypothetical protein